MNALVLANFPIAFLIFAAVVGIPLWLTFKRPERAPQASAARLHAVAVRMAPAGSVHGHAAAQRDRAAA